MEYVLWTLVGAVFLLAGFTIGFFVGMRVGSNTRLRMEERRLLLELLAGKPEKRHDGFSETEILVEVEPLRAELVAMKAEQRHSLDSRKRRRRQAFINPVLERQQQTLQKAIDLIDKMRAEYQRP